MPDQYYDSKLTGEQLDAAFLQVQNIQQTATQVQSNATAAAQSASQAASSASAASGSASQASTSAGQAAESAADASGRADAAAESARQAAASAASIEGDVEQASSSASAAAQSATQASGSASAAAQSASAAADSEDSVQQNAAAAQQAAAAASQSKSDAEAAASNAASSASTAQQAASLIEENLSAIQAAPSNAQAAQQAAAQAAASASAAEDAAERAEQIADFNPADFATAAQGQRADSAVQQVNGKHGTSITLSAADVGAATAAQGTLADTAVQPADLNGYAKTSDIPTELPNPQSLGIRLGSAGSLTDYDGSIARTITITPEAIGAQPAGAASGGEVTLIANTGLTSWAQESHYDSAALATGGYDMVGIVCLCNSATATDEYSPIQWFPIPEQGETRKYGLVCMDVNNSPMGEAQTRIISIANTGSSIQLRSITHGYYYNWGNKGSADTCAVPAFLYGMKF